MIRSLVRCGFCIFRTNRVFDKLTARNHAVPGCLLFSYPSVLGLIRSSMRFRAYSMSP